MSKKDKRNKPLTPKEKMVMLFKQLGKFFIVTIWSISFLLFAPAIILLTFCIIGGAFTGPGEFTPMMILIGFTLVSGVFFFGFPWGIKKLTGYEIENISMGDGLAMKIESGLDKIFNK